MRGRAVMAERRAILESVQLARDGRIVTRHAPFAEHMCRIPVVDLPVLNALFPGLDGKSGTNAHDLAMKEFHASAASEPYRVRKRVVGGDRPRGLIIKPPAPTPAKDDDNG